MTIRRAAAVAGSTLPAVAAVVLFAAALAEIAVDQPADGWGGGTAAAIVVAAFGTLPVAFCRQRPLLAAGLVLTACGVAIGLVAPVQAPFEPFVALLVVFFAVGSRAPARSSVAAVSLVVAGGIGVALADLNAGPSNTLPAVVLVVGAWAAGAALGRRGRQAGELERVAHELTEERSERERAAIATERARIARELHDVVAHNVSVIVLHAEAGRRGLDDRERAGEAFDTIETVGRQTVDELRRLLGMLRHDDELVLAPPPSLEHLDVLAEQVRRAGLEVAVAISGTRNGIQPGLDVAAYRIVQEALTNVLKHAQARRATVDVEYTPDTVTLVVGDDGVGGDPSTADGHGLLGMRERATVYGGSFDAGAAPDGGFVVRAVLPLRDAPL